MDSLFAEEEDAFADSVAEEVDAAAPPQPVEVTPRSNSDLTGHEAAEQALLADFNAGRMPHAIILAGLPGIGKATLAYRLARFLFSQGDQGAGLFGEPEKPASLHLAPDNPVFRRVASGGHADLTVVEREFDEKKGRLKQDISAESVRKITPFLRKTAAEGGWRVVIVDGAEYLNRTSQNALLKILEEPPAKTVLILITTQPGAFLPTIRSRCRMIQLDPLPEAAVAALLDKYAPGLPPHEKAALCRLSEGSIGRALQFHQEKGVELYKELLTAISALPALDTVKAHDLADKLSRSEQQYETAREILTSWCLRLARAEARDHVISDVLPGDAEIFRRIAAAFPPRHFMNTWEKLSQLFQQTESYTLDKRQALMGAFLMLQKPDYAGPTI
jgi:DNA polymerase III subunit delta'